MTVYADILFLINFAFDAEILAILCKVYSKKIPPARFLLSACLGGLAGVFVFIPYFKILSLPPARIILPIIMTALVFLPCKKGRLAGGAAVFTAISFLFSGAIHFFGMNAFSGLLLPAGLYPAICVVKKNIKRKRSTAVLKYKDRKITVEGFFDSGNLLKSGGAPVILGSRAVFERLFGKGFRIEAAAEWLDSVDIRLVPYSALGKSGAVLGIRLDSAVIDGKVYENTVLAYCEDDFSEDLILNAAMT